MRTVLDTLLVLMTSAAFLFGMSVYIDTRVESKIMDYQFYEKG